MTFMAFISGRTRPTLAGVMAALLLLVPASDSAAQSLPFAEYEPGLIEAEDKADTIFLLVYYSERCTVCRRQQRFIDDVRLLNPSFDAIIETVRVNLETYLNRAITINRGVDKPGTLLLVRGSKEIGRLTESTDRAEIHALMEEAFLEF